MLRSFNEKVILDYLSELGVITKALIKEIRRARVREILEDAILLALKMEMGPQAKECRPRNVKKIDSTLQHPVETQPCFFLFLY